MDSIFVLISTNIEYLLKYSKNIIAINSFQQRKLKTYFKWSYKGCYEYETVDHAIELLLPYYFFFQKII